VGTYYQTNVAIAEVEHHRPTMDENFNFPTLNLSNFHTPPPPSINVESLDTPELMKNPKFRDLFHQCEAANTRAAQFANMFQEAYQENIRLKADAEAVLNSHWQHLGYVPNNFHTIFTHTNSSELRNASRNSGSSLGTNTSVAPSDSISYLANKTSQPALRPNDYPTEVLWYLDDCKRDPDIKTSASNKSRPPLEPSIRHADGTMISFGEWSAIKATARLVRNDLLSLPPPKDHRAKDRRKTKTFFRTYFPREWQDALEKMETLQPLLALCAAHWKADHVLGNALLTSVSNEDSDGEDNNREDKKIDSSSQVAGGSTKRPITPASPRKSKKAKGKAREETSGMLQELHVICWL